MGTGLFTQDNLIIPLTDQDGVLVTSNAQLDSFRMDKYNHATIVILHSTTVTNNNVLTVMCGASDGADSADATFHYRYGSAAIGSATCDVLTADATSAALELTAATYANKMLVLELDAEETGSSGNTQYNWITVDFDGSASAGTVTAIAILSKPRYAEAVMDTAIA